MYSDLSKPCRVHRILCTEQGPTADGWVPVGGDIGESIPKGIDAGLTGEPC